MMNSSGRNSKRGWRVLLLSAGLLLLVGSVFAQQAVVDVYQQDVPEMTTLECAKCHIPVFNDLRDAGGLHKQACRDCHEIYHSFTPGLTWEERVPACSSCHDLPHGEELTACLDCHRNAHAPLASMVVAEALVDQCSTCHQDQQQELDQNVSAHSEQACADCHQGERHGQRPFCTLCHEQPHTEFVDNASCSGCHPPHAPLVIRYDNKVDTAICANCHSEQREVQKASNRKHRTLACVICHADEHGNTLNCQHCHGLGPHNPTLLKNFSGCGDCHGDPHGLRLE
jgi:hypothetical protein